MEKYIIFAFQRHGYFYCEETEQKNQTILKGRFERTGEEYLFIKHSQDMKLTINQEETCTK